MEIAHDEEGHHILIAQRQMQIRVLRVEFSVQMVQVPTLGDQYCLSIRNVPHKLWLPFVHIGIDSICEQC